MGCLYSVNKSKLTDNKVISILSPMLNGEKVTYWDLHNALKQINEDSPIDSDTDMLFSIQTDTASKLEEIKTVSRLTADRYGNIVEDDIGGNVYNIQHFLDSQYFDPEQKYYLKMNDELYKQYLREEGWSEEQINQQFNRFQQIGQDAYAIHYIVNNFNLPNANDDYSWTIGVTNSVAKKIEELKVTIQNNKLTNKSTNALEWQLAGFQRVLNMLNSEGSNIGAQIRHTLINTARENKVDDVSCKRVRNIGLYQTLNDLGIQLLGHIDQLIVDKYGNIAIYQHKVTSEPMEVWSKSKRKKFELELAFLRNILKAKGFSANKISLHMIPTYVQYEGENIKSIKMLDPINVQVSNGNYNLKEVDDIVNNYLSSKVTFKNISSNISKAADITKIMFPSIDLKANEISKSIDSFIAKEYNPRTGLGSIIRLLDDPEGYNYQIRLGNKTKKIKEITPPKDNTEIKEYLEEEFSKSDEQLGTVLDTLVTNIQTARRNNETPEFKAFKRSHYQLISQLDKYINPIYIGGEPYYEWEIIDNQELRDNHILLFKNSKGQIDVVTLTTNNLYEVNKKGNNTNILNSYISDSYSGNLYNYNASFGHIHQINTLNILNEVLPTLEGNYKLGNMQVISVKGRGQGMYSPIADLVSQYYVPILDIVQQHNSGLHLQNNLSDLEYVDQYQLVAEYCQELLNTSSYTENNPIKTKLQETITDLDNANNDSAKRTALSGLLEYLQNNPVIKMVQTSNVNITELNENSKLLINVYNQACTAFNKLNDIHVETKHKKLSWAETNLVKPDAISDNNFKTIKSIVTQTTFRANERVIKQANAMMNLSRKYLDKVGYSKAQGAIVGNETSYFQNMFILNNVGEPTMMFKNPYKDDVENRMTSDEKAFLKGALFEFAKVTYSMHNKPFHFTSYEDPKFIEEVNNNEILRRVPLMRASSTLSFSSLKNDLIQLKETAQGLVSADNNIFARWQQTLDKEGVSRSMRDRYEEGVINPFYASMTKDDNARQEALNTHPNSYWETNIPAILYSYINQNILTQEFNKSLILIKSVLFQAKMLALNANNQQYLNWLQNEADKYLTVNVFKDSILEESSKKAMTIINPLRHFVSKVFLSFNIKSMVRDTLEGFQQNYVKSATKYGTDLKAANITKAYKIVTEGSFTSVRDITLLNQLCIKYGLSNLDFANIANGLRTDKSGINHFDDIAFATMKRPDFLNRMTLFVARCIQDGVWDAYSIDKEGNVIYDWTKDKRFSAIKTAKKGSKEYNDALSAYYSQIRLYNKEHIDSPIEFTTDKENGLPSPYSLDTIEKIKQVADSIYGNYDTSGKAMAENMAVGMSFGQFTTYMNGIIANWFSRKRVIKGDKTVQCRNEKGQLLYFTQDGEVTTENTGIPVVDGIPMVVQGVFGTFGDIISILAENNDIEEKKKAFNKLLKNPSDAANLRKALVSLLYCAIISALFKEVLDPSYKDFMKENRDNVLADSLMYVLYNGAHQSTENFKEVGVIYEYFNGDSTNGLSSGMQIPYQAYPVKLIKSAYNTIIDPEKHWGEYIVNNVPSLSMFREATKAYYAEN